MKGRLPLTDNMNCPKLAFTLILTSVAALCTAHARIGETKTELERRLTHNRRAIEFEESPWNRAPTPLRNLEQILDGLESAKVDFKFELMFYFKKDKDENIDTKELEKLENTPGWLLHVLYVDDRSVAEGYVRNKGTLTEKERNGLLILQADKARWVTEQNLTEEMRETMKLDTYAQFMDLMKHYLSTDEKILKLLEEGKGGSDRNFFRTDGKVAAVQFGQSLVFYDVGFHNRLAEVDEAYKSETVTESLDGF